MKKIIISGAITERKNEFGVIRESFFERIPGTESYFWHII